MNIFILSGEDAIKEEKIPEREHAGLPVKRNSIYGTRWADNSVTYDL